MELKTLNSISKKETILAKHAGFCYGVKRAVDLSTKIKSDSPESSVYILGQLIHNNQVIEHLKEQGIETVYSIDEIPDRGNCICIIRTHGASPETFKQLKAKGCKVIDATCPDVKRVQDKAKSLSEEGYNVVIIGKPDHPEVIGIKAHADMSSEIGAVVVSNAMQAQEFVDNHSSIAKVGIVIQTTQKTSTFKEILPIIAQKAKELKVFNTICSATSKRQHEAKELAKRVHLMVVVGSKSSANTTHLAEILSQITETIHIETSEELYLHKDLLSKADKIAVTAGASTPKYVINKIINEIGD